MRVLCAAAVIAMLVGTPVHAQNKSMSLEDIVGAKTPDQIEKEKAAEKAYKDSLTKIPDAKAPADPWGSARGTDAPKAAAKAPAKKPPAKTGNTAN